MLDSHLAPVAVVYEGGGVYFGGGSSIVAIGGTDIEVVSVSEGGVAAS